MTKHNRCFQLKLKLKFILLTLFFPVCQPEVEVDEEDVEDLDDAEGEEVALVVVQHRPEVLGELLQDHLHYRAVLVPLTVTVTCSYSDTLGDLGNVLC